MEYERYHLVCTGRLVDDFLWAEVRQSIIQQFKVSQKMADKILDANPTIIKSNISWKQAIAYCQALLKMGVKSELRLVIDPKVFKDCLFEVESGECAPKSGSDILSFKLDGFRPTVYAGPSSCSIMNGKNLHATIHSHTSAVGRSANLMFSLIAGLIAQIYFLKLISPQFGASQFITIISLGVLIAFIVVMVMFLSTNGLFSVYSNIGSRSRDLFYERVGGLIGIHSNYRIYSDGEYVLATVKRNLLTKRSTCADNIRAPLFTVDHNSVSDDETSDAAASIREYLISFGIFDYIGTLLDKMRGLAKLLKVWPRSGTAEWDSADAVFVRDVDGNVVAHIYVGSAPGIHLLINEADSRYDALFAFAMIESGLN